MTGLRLVGVSDETVTIEVHGATPDLLGPELDRRTGLFERVLGRRLELQTEGDDG